MNCSKIVMGLGLAVFSTVAMAGGVTMPKPETSGVTGQFFFGAAAGGSYLNVTKDIRATPFGGGTPTMSDLTDYGNGAVGELFAGYQAKIGKRFALGIEADVAGNTSHAREKITNWNGTGKNVKLNEYIRGSYGVSVLPGIYITPKTDIYLRLGARRGYFESKSGSVTTQAGGGDRGFSGSFSKWLTGFQTGIGIDTMLNKWSQIGIEFDHTNYSSVSKTTVLPSGLGGSTVETHYRPMNNQILVRYSIIIPT